MTQRRAFAASGLGLLLAAGLWRYAGAANAVQGAIKWSLRPWLAELDEASTALASGAASPAAWQDEVARVLGRVEMADFLKSIDFEVLAARASFPARGEGMERLYFPDSEGRLQPLRFRPFLFTLRRDTAVVPHGHHNMATLHMTLAGQARVRHFDRLESTGTHMVIRSSSDVVAGPGVVTSVSDERHNIHWFQALSERVFMFNIGVYQVVPDRPFGERDYVDPLAGVAVEGGAIRVPRLDRLAAYAKYGHA